MDSDILTCSQRVREYINHWYSSVVKHSKYYSDIASYVKPIAVCAASLKFCRDSLSRYRGKFVWERKGTKCGKSMKTTIGPTDVMALYTTQSMTPVVKRERDLTQRRKTVDPQLSLAFNPLKTHQLHSQVSLPHLKK